MSWRCIECKHAFIWEYKQWWSFNYYCKYDIGVSHFLVNWSYGFESFSHAWEGIWNKSEWTSGHASLCYSHCGVGLCNPGAADTWVIVIIDDCAILSFYIWYCCKAFTESFPELIRFIRDMFVMSIILLLVVVKAKYLCNCCEIG